VTGWKAESSLAADGYLSSMGVAGGEK
jgi:hypothetical protein